MMLRLRRYIDDATLRRIMELWAAGCTTTEISWDIARPVAEWAVDLAHADRVALTYRWLHGATIEELYAEYGAGRPSLREILRRELARLSAAIRRIALACRAECSDGRAVRRFARILGLDEATARWWLSPQWPGLDLESLSLCRPPVLRLVYAVAVQEDDDAIEWPAAERGDHACRH